MKSVTRRCLLVYSKRQRWQIDSALDFNEPAKTKAIAYHVFFQHFNLVQCPFEKLIYLRQEQLNQARQPEAVDSNKIRVFNDRIYLPIIVLKGLVYLIF